MDRLTLDLEILNVDTFEPETVESSQPTTLGEDTITGGCPSSCACCTG